MIIHKLANLQDKTMGGGLIGSSPVRRLCSVSFIALALIFVGCSKSTTPEPARSGGSADVRSSADVVKATSAPASIPAGGSGEALVTLSISPGFHVNANPATFPYLIATQLTAETVAGISADKPVYPSAEKKKFAFADEPLAVYEGEAQIKLPLRADANAKGTISLPINLRVQACDQEKCFPPDTLRASIAVEIK